MVKKLIVFIILFLSFFSCQTIREALYYIAPVELPDTIRQMKSPGFWINKISSPDTPVMTPDEIHQFNDQNLNKLKVTTDILSNKDNTIDSTFVLKKLNNMIKYINSKKLYHLTGELISHKELKQLYDRMNTKTVQENIKCRYGMITQFANQRALPTAAKLTAEPFDLEFDELQVSGFDIGTEVVILHESLDGEWYFVMTEVSEGWIHKENIALCSFTALEQNRTKKFLTIISPRADIFLNESLTQYHDFIRMGNRLTFFDKENGNPAAVNLPVRNVEGNLDFKKAFIKSSDITAGYLAYTPRNILEQAFKMLNLPYGWGDTNGEQDCSRFILEIYSTMGLKFPRNSRYQAMTGIEMACYTARGNVEKKMEVLSLLTGGTVIVQYPGHIMLFIGMHENKPYVIHETWAYRQKINNQEIIRVINKIAITGLDLGIQTKKGSHLERIQNIRLIDWIN